MLKILKYVTTLSTLELTILWFYQFCFRCNLKQVLAFLISSQTIISTSVRLVWKQCIFIIITSHEISCRELQTSLILCLCRHWKRFEKKTVMTDCSMYFSLHFKFGSISSVWSHKTVSPKKGFSLQLKEIVWQLVCLIWLAPPSWIAFVKVE